jgi:hypothetical protein
MISTHSKVKDVLWGFPFNCGTFLKQLKLNLLNKPPASAGFLLGSFFNPEDV